MKKFALFSLLALLVCVVLAFIGMPVFADQAPLDHIDKTAPLLLGNVSLFKTRTLTAAINQRKSPTTLILATFFKGEEVFDTEEVDIEIIKGKRRLAPFVAPVMEGKLVESEGRTMKTFKPPYVKPKLETTAGMEQARRLYAAAGFTPLAKPLGNAGHAGCELPLWKNL